MCCLQCYGRVAIWCGQHGRISMQRKLKERLVGAAVLIGIAVLVIPEFLSGPGTGEVVTSAIALPGENEPGMKTHTIKLDPPKAELPAPIPRTTSRSTASNSTVAKARKDPVVGAATPVLEPTAWVVQLGSFSKRENAERLAQEVNSKGFEVSVSRLVANDRTMHRVRTGAFKDRADAEILARHLEAAGQVTRVVPHQ